MRAVRSPDRWGSRRQWRSRNRSKDPRNSSWSGKLRTWAWTRRQRRRWRTSWCNPKGLCTTRADYTPSNKSRNTMLKRGGRSDHLHSQGNSVEDDSKENGIFTQRRRGKRPQLVLCWYLLGRNCVFECESKLRPWEYRAWWRMMKNRYAWV